MSTGRCKVRRLSAATMLCGQILGTARSQKGPLEALWWLWVDTDLHVTPSCAEGQCLMFCAAIVGSFHGALHKSCLSGLAMCTYVGFMEGNTGRFAGSAGWF